MESSHDNNELPWWPAGPIEKPTHYLAPAASAETLPKRGRGRGRTGSVIATSVLGGMLGASLIIGFLAVTNTISLNQRQPTFSVVQGSGGPLEGLAGIAAQALPSIARVVVLQADADGTLVPIATGSAVGFSQEGHLVTNAHVVADAQGLRVELIDGRIIDAELIGADPLTDVAVIKVSAGFVPAIALGTSTSLAIGDTAIAVGNPLGLEGGPSVTTGVVSAFGRQLSIATRELPPLVGLIQTDAPISGGSSGGALLNANGELIGITTAKSAALDTEGLGFAIPVDLVENIAKSLVADGHIDHPFLGILGTTHFGILDDGSTRPVGARIAELLGEEEGDAVVRSAFGEAGAQVDDVIIEFDGNSIRTMNELAALMRYYRADQTVDVVLVRGGEELTISITLDRRPEGV